MTGGEAEIRSLLPRLDAALAHEVARFRTRYQLSLDEFRGVYVSDAQVDALLAKEVAASALALPEPAEGPRWQALARKLQLPRLAKDILILALAPEIDTKYGPIYAYLNDDAARRWPSVDLALRLFAHGPEERELLRRALETEGPLARLDLVEFIDGADKRVPLCQMAFNAHPVLARWLLGSKGLCPYTEFYESQGGIASPQPMDDLKPLMLERRRRPVVIAQGAKGSGRRASAAALCKSMGLRLLVLDAPAALRAQQPLEPAIRQALLAARLDDAGLYVEAAGLDPDHAAARLAGAAVPVFLGVARADPWLAVFAEQAVVTLRFDAPSTELRKDIWLDALAAQGLTACDAAAHEAAARFRLNPGRIRAAAETVRLAARRPLGAEPVEAAPQALLDAARAQSTLDLGSLAARLPAHAGWDDLVLPAGAYAQLKAFAGAVSKRRRVFDEWGFARVGRGGASGLVALFGGGSGTGKTMSASVVAKSAGLDLWRIDLSSVVSKYIGETEKNLERIFTAARAGDAILFFDEADALFGKRSEVKDAHDRYANIEISYLLQRLEDHDGVVILATNLSRNIDPAFSRRLHYVVDFPMPDAGLREQLWRKAFPPEAPVAQDADFALLARRFSFSGGDIRSAALDAAFIAAQDGGVVTMPHLVRAVARQLLKQGKVPSANDFQPFHAHIAEGVLGAAAR